MKTMPLVCENERVKQCNGHCKFHTGFGSFGWKNIEDLNVVERDDFQSNQVRHWRAKMRKNIGLDELRAASIAADQWINFKWED